MKDLITMQKVFCISYGPHIQQNNKDRVDSQTTSTIRIKLHLQDFA